MKIHFAGKYSGDPDSLPHRPHKEGAVAFKEASDTKELAKIANGLAIAVLIVAFVPAVLRHGFAAFPACLPGSLLAMLTLFPHELLHAVCFREEAFVYTNLKDGMLFVVGPEDMSRRSFAILDRARAQSFTALETAAKQSICWVPSSMFSARQ